MIGLVVANLLTRYFGSHFYGVSVGIGADPLVILASAARRPARAAARCPPGDPPCHPRPRSRSARSERVSGRHRERERAAAAPHPLPAPQRADRPAQRRQAEAAGVLDRRRDRARGWHAARAASASAPALRTPAVPPGTTTARTSRSTGKEAYLDARAATLIRSTPGVAAVEPKFVIDVRVAGKDAKIWAVRPQTMFHYHIVAGRWYTAAEEAERAHVAVD